MRRKQLDALLDERLMAPQDAPRRQRCARSAGERCRGGDPWAAAGKSREARARDLSFPYVFIEERAGFNSQLFRYAAALVRAAAERTKPNGERLREYTDAALPRMRAAARRVDARSIRSSSSSRCHLLAGADARMARAGRPDRAQRARKESPDTAGEAPGRPARSSPTRPCAWRCGRAARRPSMRRRIR